MTAAERHQATADPGALAPFIVTPGQAPRPLAVVGEQIVVLASGGQTGGYEIFHQAGPEGTGPPPHAHPWDESFYVINGEVSFGVEDNQHVAVPGTLVHLPAGTIHWFRFGSGGGEMLSMTSREAASHMFGDFDREVSSEHPDLAKLIQLGQPYGFTVPPTS
jgi:quercetin dioxygenase-like cupin family protein